jgi:small subunit ribosomal protein S10
MDIDTKEVNFTEDVSKKISLQRGKTESKKTDVSFKKDQGIIRIKLRSYDHKIIDNVARQITEAILRYTSEVVGPIPLPTKIRKYTVNRSTFIHKKSRDQFEIRMHNRLIDVLNADSKVIEVLTNFNLPSSIEVKMKFL